jgi:type II secretory pathway component PulF
MSFRNINAMTLDDVIALNDEISALVRAGVPLETGLAELHSDLPGHLRQVTSMLAARTARGESLAQAIAASSEHLPPVYRAVIEAGVRAGRLPAALETVAVTARRLSETYRMTATTMLYPLLVVLVAWCAFVFFSCVLAQQFEVMFLAFQIPGHEFFGFLASLRESAWYWGPIVPVGVLVMLGMWLSGRANGRYTQQILGRIPWMSRLLRCSRMATFLEVLGLLVENQTPLPEAVLLAAEAAGDPETLQLARQLATAIENGQTCSVAGPTMFPPLVRWLLLAAGRDGALLPALRHAAAAYHRRARHQADLLRVFLPIVTTIVIGGGVTALYALMLFAPYISMLRCLSG